MAFQTVFKRYELKYLLTPEQKEKVLEVMTPYMKPDPYGRTTIRNLYFDTDTFLLIRRSIEKPMYKEKLRVRSYQKADDDSTVFVELKKKFEKVVYKRRISLKESEAMQWLAGKSHPDGRTQISDEIDYVLSYYGTLHPTVFLSYEREAYYAKDDGGFRITFDENVLSRQSDLSLRSEVGGTPLLPEGRILMEIKCGGGMPLWMTRLLSEQKIYKTSFSKYGTAYKTEIFPLLNKTNQTITEVVQNARSMV
ncbi:MAG: polyphosphate polymerase domain-containing protein [Ruminococcaceae bacterium]|nr:polyphosphate polymerase domain-containing protein [Oscillospiraceae bacterium]